MRSSHDRMIRAPLAVAWAAAALLVWPATGWCQEPDAPRVTFAVTPLLDGPCARLSGAPPDTAAARELRARLDEFRALWAGGGPSLLRAAAEATGRPFAFGETIAALHVCSEFNNLSLPLSLSMRRYLRAPPAGELADSLHRFVPVVFHEVLHRYVVDLLGSAPSTPLWRKYAAEPELVRWHLHLMAIEDAAFRRTGRLRELASVRAAYARWPSYRRAREIVDAEGAAAFLAELRPAARPAGAANATTDAGPATRSASASGVAGGGPAREASVRAELQALIGELNAAWEARDRTALERIYAPEFVWVHGFGYVDDRATHIDEGLELRGRAGAATPVQLSFDPPNRLLLYGDMAVLRVSSPGRGADPIWGTTIYTRRDGRWQIAQIQGTVLNPERAAVPVAAATLDAYVGRYDRGGGLFSEISREGDALVVRHPTLPKRTLTPVADNRFFDKGGNEYTFHHRADGRVTHLVIRVRSGQELRGVKLQ